MTLEVTCSPILQIDFLVLKIMFYVQYHMMNTEELWSKSQSPRESVLLSLALALAC